ncbi:hypothetical protein [Streptomyces sp. NPDC086182]|uniref:hypothetical protein n=1 Tax=Streptomyces sp. NPDC086182 TaxID=3155058 RepID=UPI00344605BC
MSRLSREQKRELKRQRSAAGTGGQPTTGMTPIEVHVPASAGAAGPAVRGAAGAPSGATVGGVPVVPAPGETVQGAILSHLHRLALGSGHAVLATIHDERIGFVVPLQVHVDGSSRYTGEPVHVAPPVQPHGHRADRPPRLPAQEHRHAPAEDHLRPPAHNFSEPPAQERRPQPPVQERPQHPGGEGPRRSAQEHPRSGVEERPYFPVQERPQPPAGEVPQPPERRRPEPPAPPLPPAPVSAEGSARAAETPGAPRRDKSTYVLRAVTEPNAQPTPGPESGTPPTPATRPETAPAPAFPPPAASPESAPPASGPEPVPMAEPAVPGTPMPSTFVLRAVPEPRPLPGAASTHVLRAVPESAAAATPVPTGEFGPAPLAVPVPEPQPAPEHRAAASERKPASAMEALSLLPPEPEPEPKPAPVRGFDAVAEAVLAPSPQKPSAEQDAASAFLVEPVARINEAVKTGRIEAAAGMAERVVAEAAQSLGQEHPEVLKLRELTAYIAYLAGDALRSFHLSLDLARVRRRHRDTGAAYGNIQSAAAAWRAVRDPLQGLHLGRDLIGVWTELTADDGPAADDLGQLESARTRMRRLADRAHVVVDNPYTWTPRAHGE